MVPAAVPKSRTEVKTKVSETDSVAGTDGSLTVIDPLSRVSSASKNHCLGQERGTGEYIERPIAKAPRPVTVTRKILARASSAAKVRVWLTADMVSAYIFSA